MGFFDTILYPLEWFVAFVMVGFHKVLHAVGMPASSGWTWALSIVGLVVVLRVLLIPLFVKQIHSSRRMQLIQPEMQKIQAKYKGRKDAESRQKQQEEMMELYRRTGTNPFSSCLPILLQSPFFFALFRVLDHISGIASGSHEQIGWMTKSVAQQVVDSKFLGARLSDSFMGSGQAEVKLLTVVLIVIMSVTVFTTQRQLMRKNMPQSALDNPMANVQKYMMWGMPVFFAISGINFPIGVLIYWVTTNLWTMGQQFYVIRRMPTPGSQAEREWEARRAAKGKPISKLTIPGLSKDGENGGPVTADSIPGLAKSTGSGQRVQPKRTQARKTTQPPAKKTASSGRPGPGDQNGSPKPGSAGGAGNAAKKAATKTVSTGGTSGQRKPPQRKKRKR